MNFRLPCILPLFLSFAAGANAAIAPSNDQCSSAYLITNVANWCSSPRQFSTEGASASGLQNAACWPSFFTEPDNDVWFKFTARATSVSISVIGAVPNNPGGTLQYPQFSLYQGSCSSNIREVGCMSDSRGFNIVETFVSLLTVGETYLIRVDGRSGKTGSFQLCVNNFNPVPSPASDCATAVVLCDKSSFTVPNVTGAGRNRNELPGGICLPEESSSAWYKWTCDQTGTLTFTLKPVNPGDDLDFALFLLPLGVDDCSMKLPYRCMASGENVDAAFALWKKCAGTTGLRSQSADIVEAPGCQDGDDNFLAPLIMEAGQSFALVVNNYHNTGNGFSVEFAGTGTFKGPVAHFTVSKLKIPKGEGLFVKNASSFEGGIKSWEYNFGKDANPQTAKSAGPHTVKYGSAGKKSISLTIETNNGCKVTKVREITVVNPPPAPPKPAPEMLVEKTEARTETEAEIPPPPPSILDSLEEEPPPPTTPPAGPAPTPETVALNVKYTATIYFQSDSSSLDSRDIEVLTELLQILQENPSRKAIVEGHTNNIPADDYCQKLGAARADAVIVWLKNHGISDDRIVREVYGKEKIFVKEPKFNGRQVYQKAVVQVVDW